MNFDVLAVNANPLLNLVHGGDFTPGAVNRVAAMTVTAEGKGVNVARVLARHGHYLHKRGRVYLMLRPDMHASRRHRQSKSGQEPIHEMRGE